MEKSHKEGRVERIRALQEKIPARVTSFDEILRNIEEIFPTFSRPVQRDYAYVIFAARRNKVSLESEQEN